MKTLRLLWRYYKLTAFGVVILTLGLFYIHAITMYNATSLTVAVLVQRRDTLLQHNQDLIVQTAGLQSLQTIRNAAIIEGLVPTGNAVYASSP